MNVPLEKNITVLGYTSIQDLISHPLGTNYIHFEYMTQLSLLLFPRPLKPFQTSPDIHLWSCPERMEHTAFWEIIFVVLLMCWLWEAQGLYLCLNIASMAPLSSVKVQADNLCLN